MQRYNYALYNAKFKWNKTLTNLKRVTTKYWQENYFYLYVIELIVYVDARIWLHKILANEIEFAVLLYSLIIIPYPLYNLYR